MTPPAVSVEPGAAGAVVRLAGAFTVTAAAAAERALAGLRAASGPMELDLSGIEAMDTAGALLLVQLHARLEAEGALVEITGAAPARAALIAAVARALPETPPDEMRDKGLAARLARLGASVAGGGTAAVSLVGFVGLTLARLANTLIRPGRLRLTALVHQMQEVGLAAVPIVALMGFLIGVVLAFQGATQLRQFGAEVFVVDLIAISVLRELGILLTAIIVAGRSGSAFTASIGSMQVREEVDAMRTLGLDPIEVLVLPRVLALLVMLPILGFVANISGLLGGMVMSWVNLGVSPGMFVTRLHANTDVWHLGVGMIKAPFFALIVGMVACWQGFQVQGSAESVGRCTTASVVQGIFLVIVANALFSIFFSELGI